MPAPSAYEYTLIRAVPRVERDEFINVGVVLFCRERRFLAARLVFDPARLAALAPGLDLETLRAQLDHIPIICAGGRAAGPIGELPAHERFRWLSAPRSAVIQPSEVHVGLCADPVAVLERLAASITIPF
ncbi:hypothetical protein OSCT_0829 [Oscillochloris trichoides DG-6]|uniref:DUF3037 domain-containing protein n=1 Tax=Oscillochloris trichoides DG-6 TaxID=765420 RepID=E1IBX8_9CHLR|nr:DUF3037 domain-containing protein [Oscillochloris trichoides]EFO81306.1 hypothetical protein OSCT_0829 [Oscillochloris trichoides DG-6]